MQAIIKRIVIYSTISMGIFAIFWEVTKIKQVSPMGNLLSIYFYCQQGTCRPSVKKMAMHETKNITNSELAKFYAGMHWEQEQVSSIYRAGDETYTWLQLDQELNYKPGYLEYWSLMRPIMQEYYNENLPKVTIDHPVVHFRCSDSPHNKQKCYHLTKAKTVVWMADKISEQGYNTVTLLSCHKHRSQVFNNCRKYADYYANIFSQRNIKVNMRCGSVLEDFALMYQAPLLVSLNTSSYSFMAGVAKEPHNYITSNMGLERDGKYYKQRDADWIIAYDDPLLHIKVDDYNDFADVVEKLEAED